MVVFIHCWLAPIGKYYFFLLKEKGLCNCDCHIGGPGWGEVSSSVTDSPKRTNCQQVHPLRRVTVRSPRAVNGRHLEEGHDLHARSAVQSRDGWSLPDCKPSQRSRRRARVACRSGELGRDASRRYVQ